MLGQSLSIGQIDLSKPLNEMEFELPIELDEGIISEELLTTATVKIEWKQKAEKTFTVTNISLQDVPQGMEAELITKSLEITVRGLKEDLKNLRSEDITVIVSAANLQAGSVTAVDAVIQINSDADLTPIGTYPIKVSLAAAD